MAAAHHIYTTHSNSQDLLAYPFIHLIIGYITPCLQLNLLSSST
jgi:hypothetical protein